MEKEHLIEQIKKLLALSENDGATEAERNSAYQFAQKLMCKYSVSIDDTQKESELKIIEKEYIPRWNLIVPPALANPYVLQGMCQTITNNFGCWTFCRGRGFQAKIYFMGFSTNIEVAQYVCDSILNQGIRDYREAYRKERSLSFGTAFWAGFAKGLAQKFNRETLETGLILYDKVKEEFTKKVSFVRIDMDHTTAAGSEIGIQSAKQSTINQGISAARGNLLK